MVGLDKFSYELLVMDQRYRPNGSHERYHATVVPAIGTRKAGSDPLNGALGDGWLLFDPPPMRTQEANETLTR